MRSHWFVVPLFLLAGSALAASGKHEDRILILGNDQGSQTLDVLSSGTRAEYSYNDRGRGDHIVATWKLDANGVPTEYQGKGNDYMKAPVTESFKLANGKAHWQSRSEKGEKDVSGSAFYVPVNGPPEMFGVLARALLKAPDHRIALLPEGEARIELAGKLSVDTAKGKVELTQYRITGLGFTPSAIWLEADGATGASVSGWFSTLPAAYVKAAPQLIAAQEEADNAWSAKLANDMTHVPTGALVIKNARLFDPRDLSVTAGTSVLVRGERIVRVAPDADIRAPADAEVIDAHGQFLMPGMWDCHQHFSDIDGPLDLIAGVTSARDMANDTDSFLERVKRFDSGAELGPRVLKAGIIDGTGQFAGPTKMRVDTADEAKKDVDWYGDHGYAQIKIYSSIKPELMPLIADEAHARGMRVSGHVPAFMSARMFVDGGADEIQHLNFIFLNFLFDTVKETRNTNRFTAVGEHARELTPDKPEVKEFIAFLQRHHTVLDPTVNIFEGMFSGDPSAQEPGLVDIAPRLPPQVRRNLNGNTLVPPKGKEDAYRAAFPAMLAMLKALHDAGVTLVPGTDALAGYMLHHELLLWSRAGIAPAEVLRAATLTPAQVMGVDGERGAVAAGKLADLVLVDGDPSKNIADIKNVRTVIKGGKVFDPARIEAALGILPKAK